MSADTFDLAGEFLDDIMTRSLQTGIRAAVACLVAAGYLAGDEAIAYACTLGAEEVDPLVVLALGTEAGEQAIHDALEGPFHSEAGRPGIERAVADLTRALGILEAHHDEARQAQDTASPETA